MASNSAGRTEIHFRRIDMRGYRREDGLYEVEGRVVDQKPHEHGNPLSKKLMPANQALHDMGVCIVFDERFEVRDIRTFTDAAPYTQCPEGGRALASLIGLRMTSGWSRRVRERLGGAASCTHLMQLLMPMATVAFQSLGSSRRNAFTQLDATGRPAKIDSCYAYGAERELVRIYWPEFSRPSQGR